jgi:hypothetical protein
MLIILMKVILFNGYMGFRQSRFNPVGINTTKFNIQQFYVLPT